MRELVRGICRQIAFIEDRQQKYSHNCDIRHDFERGNGKTRGYYAKVAGLMSQTAGINTAELA